MNCYNCYTGGQLSICETLLSECLLCHFIWESVQAILLSGRNNTGNTCLDMLTNWLMLQLTEDSNNFIYHRMGHSFTFTKLFTSISTMSCQTDRLEEWHKWPCKLSRFDILWFLSLRVHQGHHLCATAASHYWRPETQHNNSSHFHHTRYAECGWSWNIMLVLAAWHVEHILSPCEFRINFQTFS